MGKTLYQKVFDAHLVDDDGTGSCLIYVDRHLLHEVTSPQAFEGLKCAGRAVRRKDCTLATVDHNIPTETRVGKVKSGTFIKEPNSRLQVKTLERNVKEFGLSYFGLNDTRQGIVHVIGPEQGFTLPGTVVVCGDSHTSTHGAFGALAFGIGTSEVEHVLATQTIIQTRSKNMRIFVEGRLSTGVTSKDLILHVISKIGTAGGTGSVIEFAGPAVEALTMESRMSMCNMAIEAGARAGMIKPDKTTFDYIKGRPLAPVGNEWEKAIKYWETLYSDEDATFDQDLRIKASDVIPTVTWGTSPQDALAITSKVPDPDNVSDPAVKSAIRSALEYMGLEPNTPLTEIKVDKVFIGSCTNARIEDLRAAAAVVSGYKKSPSVKRVLVVPGSGLVKKQAEEEGLDRIFQEAGFEWREAGCSMCLGMNPDILDPYERCASTSNRNFEGRQGALGRTHLMSPSMAAAAGISGHLVDIRDHKFKDNNLPQVSIEHDEQLLDATYNEEKAPMKKEDDDDDEDEVWSSNSGTSISSISSQGSTTGSSQDNGMQKVSVVEGIAAPLDKANVDTDAIIPKQFLKTIKRTGLKDGLFYSWRNKEGESGNLIKTDFVLNRAPYSNAKILVVSGENFGCGSSREHAPWALKDFGIMAIIAPSFGDIFFNNSFKNGLLPIRLPQDIIVNVLNPVALKGKPLKIDLVNQSIIDGETNEVLVDHFEIDPFKKHCLINGLDDIGLTLQKEELISKYEAMRAERFSFLESASGLIKSVKGSKQSLYGVQTQEW